MVALPGRRGALAVLGVDPRLPNTCMCVYTPIYVYIGVYIYICVYVDRHLYTHIYVCVLFVNIERERERERECRPDSGGTLKGGPCKTTLIYMTSYN